MGGGARLPPPRPPRLHFHPSTPIPYLHATAPVAASSTLFVHRPAPIPSARVSRPRRRAAMSATTAADSSSTIGVSDATGVDARSLESVGQNDLLIVGPGVLGRIVAEMWKQEHPGSNVYGHTATTDHHCELTELGIIPSLKGSIPGPKFPYVIFCAPPYRSEDYAGDLRVAASNWNGEGSFLFTSSTAVYDCSDNGLCSEDSPCIQIGQSPRTDVLLKAENVVLEAGGCVLRLVGLYKSDRGPHVYWLSKGTLDARPDHILNLIHYEDAASLAIAIMKRRLRGRIFVGCDNEPLSRQEIMDRVNRSGKFDTKFQGFTGTDGPLGKRMENSKTRAEIGWQPKYPSFTEFLGLSNL
ncbi:hypothetical protein SETIT_5G166600v2 [Setaria italica]|uniref:NAD-dependent epimerase/dehydratase domain-containing protein n=2 Tax=Setaria italica TaxID=4555 RepID=A0A368R5U8_SETIT|nr:uncharacterized protein LOC101758133 [Setaria italica]RCV25438.1 hypothetical protein SETIT_5G166600v2 [Setaria italica]